MENVSKTVIMIGGIIISMLIISLLVFVFGMFKNLNVENEKEIKVKEDAIFNAEFFKYYENGKEKAKVTPQDIVSIANFVKENNIKYDLNKATQNSYYVSIDVYLKDEKINNFEKKTEEYYINFMHENRKTFKCSEIRINKLTNRVEYVKYEEV